LAKGVAQLNIQPHQLTVLIAALKGRELGDDGETNVTPRLITCCSGTENSGQGQ
jgi:hypothetical protein